MQHDDSRPVNGRARAWRTARALGVVSVLVLAAAPSATSDDGLPPSSANVKGNVLTTGRGVAVPAQQYFRVPSTKLWAEATVSGGIATVKAFAISPAGSPHPYGYFPPVVVRTLAFGLVPAEATITIAQLRQTVPDVDSGTPDKDGPKKENVPVPWDLVGSATLPGDATMSGKADVRIKGLTLDGVKVPLGPRCHTKTPATVTLHAGPEYISTLGGGLHGTIDVPAFTGCGIGGEDLSPLLTSMVSSSGNSLEVAQSAITPPEEPFKNPPAPFPLPER